MRKVVIADEELAVELAVLDVAARIYTAPQGFGSWAMAVREALELLSEVRRQLARDKAEEAEVAEVS